MTTNPELKDLQPVTSNPKPDMSWWSEGIFIAAIFPPLGPIFLKLDYLSVSLIGFTFIALLLSFCFALLIAKPSRLKNRLKAITVGTTLGTLVVIGWCVYN